MSFSVTRLADYTAGQAVGFSSASKDVSGLLPAGIVEAGVPNTLTLQESTATPSDPTSSNEGRIYVKGDKLIIQFNDAGTVRYKYISLSGTSVVWTHTTTAP